MKDYLNFTGKHVIITGGRRGLGRAMSIAFAERGAKVAVVAANPDGTEIMAELEKAGTPGLYYRCDLSKPEERNGLIDRIAADMDGKVDVLINNAGIYPARSLETMSEEDYDAMLDTNAKGVFFLSKEFAGHMKNGSIINISSINATNPASKLIHYGMSKAAVEMASKSLAYELGPDIRVNCIAPGLIYKEGQEKFIPGWRESYIERSALNRLVYPEDIADTAIFLASDLSKAITGQIITVDCGVSLAPYFYNEVEDEYE